MGAGTPQKSSLGVLRICLDSYEVSSGGYLKGTVCLQIYEQINLESIHIEFSGDSEIQFHTGTQIKAENRTTTIPNRHSQKKTLVCFSRPLFTWPDRVIFPGQYTLPFSLLIPEGIPSSMNYTHIKKLGPDRIATETFAKVIYKVTIWLTPDIIDNVFVAVHQREGLPSYEQYIERIAAVKSWCCFSKGSIEYSVRLDRPFYNINDSVRVTINLDFGKAQLRPDGFNIALKYRLHLSTIFYQDITTDEIETQRLPVDPIQPIQQLVVDLRLAADKIGTLSTLHSELIKCDFYVDLSPSSACCTCAGDLSAEMRIVVNSRIPPQEQPNAPPGWNPIVIGTSEIEFSRQDSLPVPCAPPYEAFDQETSSLEKFNIT